LELPVQSGRGTKFFQIEKAAWFFWALVSRRQVTDKKQFFSFTKGKILVLDDCGSSEPNVRALSDMAQGVLN
jgi:hypothetical protein